MYVDADFDDRTSSDFSWVNCWNNIQEAFVFIFSICLFVGIVASFVAGFAFHPFYTAAVLLVIIGISCNYVRLKAKNEQKRKDSKTREMDLQSSR